MSRELRNAGDFKWPKNAGLYSRIRVRLIEPANTALVGILTGKAEAVNINGKVSIPFKNVASLEVIRPHIESL